MCGRDRLGNFRVGVAKSLLKKYSTVFYKCGRDSSGGL